MRQQIEGFVARYRPDELILSGQIHDHAARLRSFEIVAEALGGSSSDKAGAQRTLEATAPTP